MRNAVLVSAVRTPVGKKGGVFKNLKRMDLFVPVIQEALKRIDLDPKEAWARAHPERFPVRLRTATREDLLRVPGLGPLAVKRLLAARRTGAHLRPDALPLRRDLAAKACPWLSAD